MPYESFFTRRIAANRKRVGELEVPSQLLSDAGRAFPLILIIGLRCAVIAGIAARDASLRSRRVVN